MLLVGQYTQQQLVKEVNVSQTKAIYLGKTKAVSELDNTRPNPSEKRHTWKSKRSVPDNFKGRSKTNVRYPELEHQGPDKIRQSEILSGRRDPTVPMVNVNGITNGESPTDPTGDIGKDYYIQAINATEIAIFDKEGQIVSQFFASELWFSLNVSSLGDPIILYDEETGQWIITEFTGPSDILIAVSETSSPLGSFHLYRFSLPNFPDYPKYAIWADHLVVTSNEIGIGTGMLHQYFIDRHGLLSGAEDVSLQRVEIIGSTNIEGTFLTSTPVDWNGHLSPIDSTPIVLLLDDSSWGNAAVDGLRLLRFNVDMEDENNTTVEETFIPLSAYDSYPCSSEGVGFACIPQQGGSGLDGLPEIILNMPHYRRFDTHESIVFAFVADASDGDNIAGIRWTELRKTEEVDWSVYQEGTYAPDDDLHRFMAGIAIDKFQNIGIAYAVSGENDYAGLRYTGRRNGDALGIMTIPETIVSEGLGTINSAGRFGDYTQMSIDAQTGTTFWFTGEYAGANETLTKVVAFELARDTFDLAITSIVNPAESSENLLAQETVIVNIRNQGIEEMTNPTLSLVVDGLDIVSDIVEVTLAAGGTYDHAFSQSVDLSQYGPHQIIVVLSHPDDRNQINDTLEGFVTNLPSYDLAVSASVSTIVCPGINPVSVSVTNLGFQDVSNVQVNISRMTTNGSIELIDSRILTNTIEGNGGEFRFDFNVNIQQEGEIRYIVEVVLTDETLEEISVENNQVEIVADVPVNSVTVEFELLFDDYSEEVSFEIINTSTFEILYQESFSEGEFVFNQSMCLLADECYALKLLDSYGDGICCNYGQGYIILTYSNGDVIFEDNGEFGFNLTKPFCPDGSCKIEANVIAEGANSSHNGTIIISNPTGQSPHLYSIDGGLNFQESGVFPDLMSGTYSVIVQEADGNCVYEEEVIVEMLSSVSDLNISADAITIYPIPTEDILYVGIDNQDLGPVITLEVIDRNGRLIQEQYAQNYSGSYKAMISLMDRPNGLYYIVVNGHNQLGLKSVLKL